MSWLQFISSLAASFAWPSAAVLIVLLFRKVVVRLLPQLKTIKYGNVEATFGEALQEAEKDIAKLSAPALPNAGDVVVEQDFEKFSNNSAIFVAWLEVEAALFHLARSKGPLPPNVSALSVARELYGKQVIDKQTYNALRDLFELRNAAVHPTDAKAVDVDEVRRFTKLAEKVTAVLFRLAPS